MQRIIARARELVEASPEERARRLKICMECDLATVGQFMGHDYAKCGHCGCALSARSKFKNVHCPIGKW